MVSNEAGFLSADYILGHKKKIWKQEIVLKLNSRAAQGIGSHTQGAGEISN